MQPLLAFSAGRKKRELTSVVSGMVQLWVQLAQSTVWPSVAPYDAPRQRGNGVRGHFHGRPAILYLRLERPDQLLVRIAMVNKHE